MPPMTRETQLTSDILYGDPSAWVWSLDDLEAWVADLPQQRSNLAIGFCSLKRWLTEHADVDETRTRSIQLADRFLDGLAALLKSEALSNDLLTLAFGMLMTMLGEVGPYRFETKRDDRDKLERELLRPMEDIRHRAVDVSKALFGRQTFDRIRDSINAEIVPLLEGVVEVHGDEHDRFMPFRIIEVGKVAEHLLELAIWLEEDSTPMPGDSELIQLLKGFYDLKYPRFGTSGLRGRWGIDFTKVKAQRTAQAICQYLAATGIPDFVVPHAQPLSGKWVVVGYDGRRNSDVVAEWLAGVAIQNGFSVYLASLPTPTPALIYYAIEHIGKQNIAGILNCTASHNPPEWQGIKFNPKEGYPAPTHLTDIVAARANELQLLGLDIPAADLSEAERDNRLNPVPGLKRFDPIASYWDWLKANGQDNQRIPVNPDKIREYFKDKLIVVDEMHGAGRGYMSKIFGELGIRHEVIHPERDIDIGGLDYANPELPYVMPLMAAVEDRQAAVGFGLDTDADRFGVVGEGGVYFRPNQVLAMLVHYLRYERGLQGRVVITQTGLPLIDTLAGLNPDIGAESNPAASVIPAYVDHPFYKRRTGSREDMVWDNVFVVPVGIKYIVEIPRMDQKYKLRPEDTLETNWMDHLLLGGEESSGLTTRGHVPDKDGVWANLLIVDMIAHHAKPLAEIWKQVTSLPGCWESYGGRMDIDASDRAKERLISYFLDRFQGVKPGEVSLGGYPVLYAGGIRYDMIEIFLGDENGQMRNFLRIRASGTEPINRVYTETKDPNLWKELLNIVLSKLDEFTIEEIDRAYRLEKLADILAATKPGTWEKVKAATLDKLARENWQLSELKKRLASKRPHVEHRNRDVIDQWQAQFD